MERLQKITDLSSKDKSHIRFGLGEAYDQKGQTDKAFAAWLIANQSKAERYPYDLDKRTGHRDSTILLERECASILRYESAPNKRGTLD